MCQSIILSKIANQMWHDYSFSQRNKTTERAVGWGFEVTGKGGEVEQNFKKGSK